LTVFVDTSALIAFLDRRDRSHDDVLQTWQELRDSAIPVVTTNYVLLETLALVQSRLGLEAARNLVEDVVPLIAVEWVTPELHEAGIEAVLAANRRDLSLVDCISFAVMRRLGLSHAFAVDEHFREQGFDCLPAQP